MLSERAGEGRHCRSAVLRVQRARARPRTGARAAGQAPGKASPKEDGVVWPATATGPARGRAPGKASPPPGGGSWLAAKMGVLDGKVR
jgi:hypothetical protein